jgi:hypothetical protein
MTVAYLPPGIAVRTGSASNIGGNNQQGLTVALVGAFPKGPCWPVGARPGSAFPTPFPIPSVASFMAASKMQLLSTWGDDGNGQNHLAGWTGPGAGRLIYEAAEGGFTPQVFVVRTGTTQASAALPDGTGTVVWTATALLTIGGGQGNGVTCQYGTTTFTITPTAALLALGYQTETFTVPAAATWAQIAAVVNGASRLVYLNSASADTVTTAATTLTTLAGGADGAVPTLSQINAGLDSLLNIEYDTLPLHIILHAFADDGVSGALKHSLANAESMLANGQRPRVFGGCSAAAGGTGNLTALLAMAAELVPTENSGDSGRCVFWASNQPYRRDPATNSEIIYPGWAPPASHVGLEASSPVTQGFGRSILPGFTHFGEGYTVSERTGPAGLYANGVMVTTPTGRMQDQVTTAASTSFRRDDNIDRAENWWVADLANYLQNTAIEIAAGPSAGITIEDHADGKLRGYTESGIMAGYSLTVRQISQDARQWEVDVAYVPIFLVRNINPLSVQLTTPPAITLPTITVTVG